MTSLVKRAICRAICAVIATACIAAPQVSARERECRDEAAEIQGVISVIVNRTINLRGSQLGSFNVKDDNTGTCDIRDVIFRPAVPPECMDGSKFTAKGRAISGLARLVAETLVCE